MILRDKVVIISGVGPGLGQALAHVAAQEGAKVVLAARTQSYLDEVAAQIISAGGTAAGKATDVGEAEQCAALMAFAMERFGRLDGIVNSAYRSGDGKPVGEAGIGAFEACFDISCLGVLRMAQAALPILKKQGGGAIVNVSTMGSVKAFGGQAAYAVAKGGLNTLTRYIAHDMAAFGIRANVARMGWMDGPAVTQFVERLTTGGAARQDVLDQITSRIPIGMIPPQDDCARAVLFLVSDYSRMVTGAVLDINGGEYMPL